jgi:predicted RNA-binding protein with PUA-like domain
MTKAEAAPEKTPRPAATKKTKTQKTAKQAETIANGKADESLNAPSSNVKSQPAITLSTATSSNRPSTQQYWLMKAEPESRLENGHDIKFSIDDLASKTEPEPWDGIRAYPARNNLRAMKKGDLAFFYHSSCKAPAIVGIIEIIQEHSPDLSAQDLSAPYYDPNENATNPKWSLVHVSFRSKLKNPITLKELREFQSNGGPLENMQMLKQTRLSVSKVSREEWGFLMGVVEEGGGIED